MLFLFLMSKLPANEAKLESRSVENSFCASFDCCLFSLVPFVVRLMLLRPLLECAGFISELFAETGCRTFELANASNSLIVEREKLKLKIKLS